MSEKQREKLIAKHLSKIVELTRNTGVASQSFQLTCTDCDAVHHEIQVINYEEENNKNRDLH